MCTEIAGSFIKRSNAEVQAAGCEFSVKCGAYSHRNGLITGESLMTGLIVLVLEAQGRNERCSVRKDCCCGVEAIELLYLWLSFKPQRRYKLTLHISKRSGRPQRAAIPLP